MFAPLLAPPPPSDGPLRFCGPQGHPEGAEKGVLGGLGVEEVVRSKRLIRAAARTVCAPKASVWQVRVFVCVFVLFVCVCVCACVCFVLLDRI
jgi:hypothetical protein